MLSPEDVRVYFQRISKDFELLLNGNSYPFNKQSLCAFSTVVCSAVAADPSLKSLTIPGHFDDTIVKDVISFLNGVTFSVPARPVALHYYNCAAVLGIHSLGNFLLCSIPNLFSVDNIEDAFQFLAGYPSFCAPIVAVLADNPSAFGAFAQNKVFSLDFLRDLLADSGSIFPSEDAKFRFIHAYNAATDTPDLKLYHFVQAKLLSPELLETILSDRPEIHQHCKTFPLIHSLLLARSDLARKQDGIDAKIAQAQANKADIEASLAADQTQRNPWEADLATTREIHERVRAKAIVITERVELLAACISLLGILDEHAGELVLKVRELRDLRVEMGPLVDSFRNTGGWVFYPGCCQKLKAILDDWAEAATDLEKMSGSFILNQIGRASCRESV
jgi:hypothetical protein